jgi:hypothetical protein
MNSKRDNDRALFVANRISQASPLECALMFEDLRRRKRLSETVRRLNHLLDEPAHRELARTALKRFDPVSMPGEINVGEAVVARIKHFRVLLEKFCTAALTATART